MNPAAKKTRKSQKAKEKQPRPKRKLNYRQERFCELIAAGESQTEAWLKAGYKVARSTARKNAADAMTKTDIRARIEELRKPESKRIAMSKAKKRELLEEIATDPKASTLSRIRAIEVDAKLAGDFEPENIVVEAGPLTLESIRQRALDCVSALAR